MEVKKRRKREGEGKRKAYEFFRISKPEKRVNKKSVEIQQVEIKIKRLTKILTNFDTLMQKHKLILFLFLLYSLENKMMKWKSSNQKSTLGFL